MNKGLLSGVVLLVLGSVCGFLLALVNSITAPIILENELKVELQTLKEFYPNIETAYTVEKLTLDGSIETVYLLKNKTTLVVEAVIYKVSSMGYKTNVDMLIAVNADLTVEGYAVLGAGGTEGLGIDLNGTNFGMDGALISATASSFDAISGATFSSNGVLACFNLVASRVAIDLGGA